MITLGFVVWSEWSKISDPTSTAPFEDPSWIYVIHCLEQTWRTIRTASDANYSAESAFTFNKCSRICRVLPKYCHLVSFLQVYVRKLKKFNRLPPNASFVGGASVGGASVGAAGKQRKPQIVTGNNLN